MYIKSKMNEKEDTEGKTHFNIASYQIQTPIPFDIQIQLAIVI